MPASELNGIHVAFLPSAGMGHLNPCLRTASLFLRHGCSVTLITPKPTVSLAESQIISRFCSAFPQQVTQIDFNLVPLDPTTVNSTDPFWIQFETIRRSVHLLSPILTTLSPPLSAFIFDVSLISPMVPVIDTLSCPSYIYFVSSARMFSFFAHLSVLSASNPGANASTIIGDSVEIPGIKPIPRSSVPPLLLQPNSLFEKIFMEDSPKLKKLDGIFLNTFEELEPETLEALNDGRVVPGLPRVHAVGPFMPCEYEKVVVEDSESSMGSLMKWLDNKPAGSVVYVCLGNKTVTRMEQIRDMANGLVECGYSFLWVVKLKVVDREEEEEEDLEDVLGNELMKKVKENGFVVKTWVDQMEILGHPAVGGFVSHGGGNSLVEAVWNGVPMLSWAQNGDHKIVSEVVEMSGVGIWAKEWGWGGEVVVKGEEIAKAIKKMMSNEGCRIRAGEMKVAARKAAGVGGSCEVIIKGLIEEWKKNIVHGI